MSEKQIIVDDLLVNYREENPQAETSAVFLHGWMSDSKAWSLVMNKLAARNIRLIALDLPGFGKSQMPKTSFGVREYSNFVKSFLEKIGISKTALIGHSFGGRIAIRFSSEHRELVSKLVLVDSAGFVDKSLGVAIKSSISQILRPIFKLPGLRQLRDYGSELLGSKDYLEAGQLREIFVKVIREDLTSDLPRIKSPTLIIWGESDTETPLEFGRKMNSLISDSKLFVIPGAGHFSFIDKPDLFVSEIENFLL